MNTEYKRVLVINDDDTEEGFFNKYKNLQVYKDIISYCNEPVPAFEYVTSDYFGRFDKIILDIKIEWEIPEKYKNKMNKYIDADAINNPNIGFLIFMYLISKGYPISRIAFLSAYINEKDDEYDEKVAMLERIKSWKKRNKEQDKWLIQNVHRFPLLENTIIKTIKRYEGIQAYEEIKKILVDDTRLLNETSTNVNKDSESNEQFFQLLKETGLRVENKINKKDGDKLEKWIESEKTDELKNYYEFRNMALNICEYVKTIPPKIYELYKDFENSYPINYFKNLVEKIQYEISNFKEEKNIEQITENIVSNFVAFWENLNKKYISIEASKEDINNHALTMLLKHTRNWYAHGRIKELGTEFCKFIFLASIRVIYGNDETLEQYIEKKLKLENVEIDMGEEFYRNMWKNINEKITTTKTFKKNTYTYIINITDLYYKYSHSDVRKQIHLTIDDLYTMFILCLHFPYVLISNSEDETLKIYFNNINYEEQEQYMIFLEKIAINNLIYQK